MSFSVIDNPFAGRRLDEGWDLFECSDLAHAPYEIQRDDEAEVFDSDESVWLHVTRNAAAGSVLHLHALAFIAIHSPEELVGIFHALFFGHYRTFIGPERPCPPSH